MITAISQGLSGKYELRFSLVFYCFVQKLYKMQVEIPHLETEKQFTIFFCEPKPQCFAQ